MDVNLYIIVYKLYEDGSWRSETRVYEDKEKATNVADSLGVYQWLIVCFNPEQIN